MAEKKRESLPQDEEEFKPRGTVAIMVLFVLTMLFLWGYIYLLLIQRGVTV